MLRKSTIAGLTWILVLSLLPVHAAAQNPFLSQRGKRTVSAVRFHGHTITKDYVLRRSAGVEVGDAYSTSLIPEIRERLDALPFIAYVDIEARPAGPGKMDLDIEVVEDSRLRWSAGVRYERRHDGWLGDFALGWVNLTGRAESLFLHATAWNERGAGLVFDNPHILGRADIGVEFATDYVEYDWRYEDFDFRSIGVQGGAWRDFDHHLRLRTDLRWRHIEAFDGDSALEVEPGHFGGLSGDDGSIGLSLVHDSRDQRFYPFRGAYLEAATTVGNSAIGRGYSVTLLDARGYYQVRRVGILAGRAKWRHSDGDLPFYEGNYFGGPMTLRGIDFGSVRGSQSYLASVELRRPIFVLPLRDGKSIGLGVHAFHDWGQAYDRGTSLRDLSPRWDYGGGIHFNFGERNFRFEWARTDGDDTVFVFEDRFTF